MRFVWSGHLLSFSQTRPAAMNIENQQQGTTIENHEYTTEETQDIDELLI